LAKTHITKKEKSCFMHIFTGEIYGFLSSTDPGFREDTPYAPNSPCSSSKAAADHLMRPYYHIYNLPTLTTNFWNNYGALQLIS
jgi:dTDP-glucose 4,6-dehydratase